MVVATREESGAAWGAKRQGNKGVAEADAFGGDAVHVGRLKPGESGSFTLVTLHDTHGVPALVISVDKKEVGFAVGGGDGEAIQRKGAKEQGRKEYRIGCPRVTRILTNSF